MKSRNSNFKSLPLALRSKLKVISKFELRVLVSDLALIKLTMVRRCCVNLCPNSRGKPTQVIHLFPKNESKKNIWIDSLRGFVKAAVNFNLTVHGVCSNHFNKDDYVKNGEVDKKRILRPSAYPKPQVNGNIESDENGKVAVVINFVSSKVKPQIITCNINLQVKPTYLII